ncbi:MAG: YihY/virulence factor BrkB family protein [Crocinitomicaceae bacterium]
MEIIDKIKRCVRKIRVGYVRPFIHFSRKIKIPGFQGVSLWEIIFFFLFSLRKGHISMRAGAVAFHFFLALIPFGLVLVVLSAYTPGIHLEEDIAPVVSSLIPDQLFEKFMSGLREYENSSVSSLISLGFIFALYFASNGFTVLIKAFNSSKMKFSKRNWWSARLVSFGFVLIFTIGILVTFYCLVLARKGYNMWAESSDFIARYFDQIYGLTDILFLGILVYTGISFLYYYGPQNRKDFSFFSPGATLAFILVIAISVIYELYIAYYANYNALYGSLGTIIMLLLWIYMISFSLLIGFELNASIHGAIQKKRLDRLENLDKRYE